MTPAVEVASTASVVTATVLCLIVLIEYLILVPVKQNPGAKRLIFLLGTSLIMLGLTLSRIFLGDFPGRYEALSAFFWILSAAFLYLGWHIAKDQREGAIMYLKKRTKKKDRNNGSSNT